MRRGFDRLTPNGGGDRLTANGGGDRLTANGGGGGGGSSGGLFGRLVDLSTVPPEVRRFHACAGRFHGRASVTTKPWARWFGLPGRSGEFDIAVDVWRDDHGEIWTRHFPPRPMQSRLRAEGGVLVERLGFATLRFRLHASREALEWECIGVSVLGVPLPPRWFAVIARESASDGHYVFTAGASLPGLGPLVRYDGRLALPRESSASRE